MKRRRFIFTAALGSLGVNSLAGKFLNSHISGDTAPRIKDYRRLGRTGFMVSDIGSGIPTSGNLLKAVIDRGVNFVETSESYDNGRNELMIGNAIRGYPRRDLFIATKVNYSYRFARSSKDIIARAEESLSRLGCGYIDLYMVHQAQNIVGVSDNNFHRAADQLKKEGKIRFRGLSCHGPTWGTGVRDSLEDILMSAVEDGRYDVIFLPYNFLNPGIGERVLEACARNDIGTMIMKSNPVVVYEHYESLLERGVQVGRTELNDHEKLMEQMKGAESFFSRYGLDDMEKLKDGAVRFILGNEHVSTICCRFKTFDDVERYTSLSGTRLTRAGSALLEDCISAIGFLNCRTGCNICQKACPNNIPVSTIMRYSYYFHALNDREEAIRLYSSMPGSRADKCTGCKAPCIHSCPHNVPVKELLAVVDRALSPV